MKIAVDKRVPFPRPVVFAAFRDRLSVFMERSSNARISGIRARDEAGSLLRVISDWQGGAVVPAAVRGIVTPSMLVWSSQAKWDGGAFVCDWAISASAFLPEAVRCSGRTSFLAEGEGETTIQILGAVATDGRKFPGVPSFLAPKVGRSVDEFLVEKIHSNFAETAAAMEEELGRKG
jgi:hypothetical protein